MNFEPSRYMSIHSNPIPSGVLPPAPVRLLLIEDPAHPVAGGWRAGLAGFSVDLLEPGHLPASDQPPYDLAMAWGGLTDLGPLLNLVAGHARRLVLLDKDAPRCRRLPSDAPWWFLHPGDLASILDPWRQGASNHPCAFTPPGLPCPLEQRVSTLALDLASHLALIQGALAQIQARSEGSAPAPSDLTPLIQALHGIRTQLGGLLLPGDGPVSPAVPVDASVLVRDTAHILRLSAPPAVEVQAQVASGVWVTGDASRLQQALMALGMDAFQALKETGGTLRLSISETRLDAEDVAADPLLSTGPHAFLQIRDTRATPGTAILGSLEATILRHQGRVRMHPQATEHTVEIFLPCTAREAPMPAQMPSEALRGTEFILVVEPDGPTRTLVLHGLEALGYQPTGVATSQAAQAELRANPGFYQAAVLDMDQEGSTGLALAHRLRHQEKDLPILLTVPDHLPTGPLLELHTEIRDVLTKPYAVHDLAHTLRRILDGGATGSDAPAPPDAIPLPGQDETILLAEDSSVTRAVIRRWLTEGGAKVLDARDGLAAWELFQAEHERTHISMVLTDVVMPGIDGLELARRIRTLDPALPIAVMTTVEDRDTVKTALQAGVNDFLQKPFDAEALWACLHQLQQDTRGRREARRSLETAQAVRMAQRALLAVPEQDLPLFSLYEPLTDAGGDVFKAFRRPDGSILFVLGDVAGHSVISSYAVASFLGMLSTFTQPAGTLRDLANRLNRGIAEGPFSEVPVCALLGHWQPDIGRLQLLNAGIPHGLHYRAHRGDSDWIPLNGAPLGILEDPPMDETVIWLREGDRIIFGTDGFFEVPSATREIFAPSVPIQWTSLRETPIQWALSLVCEAARAHGEGVISDDLLVLGFEQGPPTPAAGSLVLDQPSTPQAIDDTCDQIKGFLEEVDPGKAFPPSQRFEIVLALREAMTNAVFHGNRSQSTARVLVAAQAQVDPLGLVLRISDEGPGYDLARHQSPLAIDSDRGRGFPLMRSCAQEVRMTGSELTLVFHPKDASHDEA